MNSQRVIKADSLRQLGRKVVFDLEDFERRCDDQIKETRQQISQYLNEAQQKAVSTEEAAKREGYEAGYAQGLKDADAEIQKRADAKAGQEIHRGLTSSLQIMETLSIAIAQAKQEWLSRWETEAVELSIAISERILRAELANRPDLSRSMIRDILEIVSSEQRLVVKLHPDDARYFQQAENTEAQSRGFGQLTEFRADENLRLGDCVVESEQGTLDGRIETQLERFLSELVPPEEAPGEHA